MSSPTEQSKFYKFAESIKRDFVIKYTAVVKEREDKGLSIDTLKYSVTLEFELPIKTLGEISVTVEIKLRLNDIWVKITSNPIAYVDNNGDLEEKVFNNFIFHLISTNEDEESQPLTVERISKYLEDIHDNIGKLQFHKGIGRFIIEEKYALEDEKFQNLLLFNDIPNTTCSIQECAVCYELTKTCSSCNHFVCYPCWGKLKNKKKEEECEDCDGECDCYEVEKECPLCKNKLKFVIDKK